MRIFTRVKWLTTKLLDKYLKNLPAGPNFYLHHCNNKFLHHTAGQEETSLSQEVLSGFLLGIRTNLKINLLVFLQTKNRSGVISWPVMPCHFGHNLTGLWGAPALRWCRSPLDWLSWAKGDVLQGRSCSRKGTVLPGLPSTPITPTHTPGVWRGEKQILGPHFAQIYIFYFLSQEDISSKWPLKNKGNISIAQGYK